jgi:hypothetical protein
MASTEAKQLKTDEANKKHGSARKYIVWEGRWKEEAKQGKKEEGEQGGGSKWRQ